MHFALNHRVAVVTGAGSGIGRAIAGRLANAGARVVIADIDADGAARSVHEITENGGEARAVTMDVSDEADVRKVLETIRREFGLPDILVNNVGIYPATPLAEISKEEWNRVFDINLWSMLVCSRNVAPMMVEKRFGRIINIASVDALAPAPGVAHYAAAKAGVISLTRTMALMLAPHGVTVNAVAPGWVGTERVLKADRWRQALPSIPIGRISKPEEIAAAVHFLASEEAGYITGEILNVNGGLFMY